MSVGNPPVTTLIHTYTETHTSKALRSPAAQNTVKSQGVCLRRTQKTYSASKLLWPWNLLLVFPNVVRSVVPGGPGSEIQQTYLSLFNEAYLMGRPILICPNMNERGGQGMGQEEKGGRGEWGGRSRGQGGGRHRWGGRGSIPTISAVSPVLWRLCIRNYEFTLKLFGNDLLKPKTVLFW